MKISEEHMVQAGKLTDHVFDAHAIGSDEAQEHLEDLAGIEHGAVGAYVTMARSENYPPQAIAFGLLIASLAIRIANGEIDPETGAGLS